MKWIFYLSRGGYTGGSQRQLHHVIQNLDRSRYEPIVVCREAGQFAQLLGRSGVETRVIALHAWRKFPQGVWRYSDARQLAELARSRQVALIHSSDLWLSGYLWHVARSLSIPSILHVRSPEPPQHLRKHRCDRATAVIAISARVKNNLLEAGVTDEKITTIYDAANLEQFHSGRAGSNVLRRDFPEARGTLVGIVGRIQQFKRQLEFLRAAHCLVRSRHSDVTFFVIGETQNADYGRRVQQFAAETGLTGRVIFTGRREDMPEVLASLDVLVTLSGGSVMIEAMASGTPVISAGFTPPSESTIVCNGQTGLLISPGRESELDAAVGRLVDDPALRRRMGRAARRHAKARYSHLELAAATQRLYDHLLDA